MSLIAESLQMMVDKIWKLTIGGERSWGAHRVPQLCWIQLGYVGAYVASGSVGDHDRWVQCDDTAVDIQEARQGGGDNTPPALPPHPPLSHRQRMLKSDGKICRQAAGRLSAAAWVHAIAFLFQPTVWIMMSVD